jgi:cob(I)alamin adenosyltransferase
MKVYTKGGDKGKTALWGAGRVSKADPRLDSYGEVDELNSLLGVILAEEPDTEIEMKLRRIQSELMRLGSDLATPLSVSEKIKQVRIENKDVERLEKEIDELHEKLPELKNFILPGGDVVGSHLHWARTVCRRAERAIVKLVDIEEEEVNLTTINYINRLSDWLFMMARYSNLINNTQEKVWKSN